MTINSIKSPLEPKPKTNGGCILFIIIGALIIGGIFACFFSDLSGQIFRMLTGSRLGETRPLASDASAFEPFANYEAAAEFAGEGAQLLEISMYYVRSDGTMELTASYVPAPRVTYTFGLEIERPADAPPPGAGGSSTGPWYQNVEIEAFRPGDMRTITQTGGGVSTRIQVFNQGMMRDEGWVMTGAQDFVEPPQCDMAEFWTDALEEGAPEEGVAIVEYDSDGYSFRINTPEINISNRYSFDCARID